MFTKKTAEKRGGRRLPGFGWRCPCNLAVYFRPLRQFAEVAVVDIEVGGDFAAGLIAGRGRWQFLGIVGVDGVEFEASLGAPCHCLLEELAFTDCPQDEMEVGHVALELPQGGNCKGEFLTYGGVTVLDYGAADGRSRAQRRPAHG